MNREKWEEVVGVVTGGTGQLGFRGIQDTLRGGDVPPNWFYLWIALEVEPDPVSAKSLAIQGPYGAQQNALNQLAQLAEGGYLDTVGEKEYRLSDKGREKLLFAIDVLNKNVAKLSLLDNEKTARIDELLGKVVNSALNDGHIDHPHSLQRNHNSYPGDDVAPIVRVFHYLTDIAAYSDDAHMETWRWNDDGVDGPTWEAFTNLWRDGLNTAEKIHEQLSNRGHDIQVYENALKTLVNLGWVSGDGEYAITDEGQKVRDEAEAQTKDNYFAPIESLGDEADELLVLMTELKAAVEAEQALNRKRDIWQAGSTSIGVIAPHYMHMTVPVLQQNNLFGQQFTFLSHAIGEDVFTAEKMHNAQPFNNLKHLQKTLEGFVEDGFFEKVDGGYVPTKSGDTGIRAFYSTAHEALKDLEPLPEDELNKLTGLLKRVVDAAVNLDRVNDKTNLLHSRVFDPGEGAGYLALIDQYLTDLNYFRDDAHNATWRALGVNAISWDALTQVWNGTANTPEAVNEALNRQYTLEDYQAAFNTLVDRGWLAENNGEYSITPEGQAVRDQAEVDTDANFYAPFDALSDEEQNDLLTLIQKFEKETRLSGRQEIYKLTQEVSSAYAGLYQPMIQELVADIGFQTFDWFYTYVASAVYPEPFTIEAMQKIVPYARQEDRFNERAAGAAERGFLKKVDGGYQATEKGRDGIAKFFTDAYGFLKDFKLLDEDTMQNTAELLKKVVDGIESSDTEKFFFDVSRTSQEYVADDASAIDQYVTDLGRWRDDAHVASWKPSGLNGHQFETLSFVWNGEATTAEAIHEKRQNRGYSVEEFQQTLDALVEKGLIEADGDGYKVTDEGKTLRDDIEEKTNEIFFESWDALNGGEPGRLRLQLLQLKEQIEAVTPQPEQA